VRGAAALQECEECPNVKLTQQTVELDFEIEKGMDTGYVITLAEAGEPHPDGDSGDLNIHVVGLPDPVFKREGANLKVDWEISLSDALTGFSHELDHLDGHKVCVCSCEPCMTALHCARELYFIFGVVLHNDSSSYAPRNTLCMESKDVVLECRGTGFMHEQVRCGYR
jgi:hypothetical protein